MSALLTNPSRRLMFHRKQKLPYISLAPDGAGSPPQDWFTADLERGKPHRPSQTRLFCPDLISMPAFKLEQSPSLSTRLYCTVC